MAKAETPKNGRAKLLIPKQKDPYAEFRAQAKKIMELREAPLLVIYYPSGIPINEQQIKFLHKILRASIHKDLPLARLDVILHTLGGDPATAYRLAQVVRDAAEAITYLIPEFAYSAGTLMCLSADSILLGEHAVLSPIDVTLVTHRSSGSPFEDDEDDLFPEEDPSGEAETVAIDYFISVAKQARIAIESEFRKRRWKNSKTDVECALLTEMTRQLGVLTIAKYYREKNTTQEYAEVLLRYMFGSGLHCQARTNRVLRQLIAEAPSHDFPIDFHMCEDMGLVVEEMAEDLSELSQNMIIGLTRLAREGAICVPAKTGYRLPHFEFFPEPKSIEVVKEDEELHNETKPTTKTAH